MRLQCETLSLCDFIRARWGAVLSGVSVPHTDYVEQNTGCFLSFLLSFFTHGDDFQRNVSGGQWRNRGSTDQN